MPNFDDILEKKLEALEKGQPMDKVLADLPQEAIDLGALLHLASSIRAMPHPQPTSVLAHNRLESAAAREKTRPITHPRLVSPRPRIVSPLESILSSLPRILMPQLRLSMAVGFAAVTLVLLFTLVAFFSLAGSGRAKAATLTEMSGVVRVASARGGEEWLPLEAGDKVRAGQRILTGPDSSLTLEFYEGSRMTLGPYSYVTLNELKGSWGKSLRLMITQHAGKTAHDVVPLRGSKSAYQVVTPAGVVNVRGTSFSVEVGLQGTSRYAVNTGKVVVSGQNAELALVAGQAATALPGLLPQEGDYQFTLEGMLTGVDEETGVWIVNGVSFLVSAETLQVGTPAIDSFVEIEGRIDSEGDRIADHIAVIGDDNAGEDESESTLTGILKSIDGNTWLIDGTEVVVDEDTDLGYGIALDMPVSVKFYVDENGNWVALEIESLDDEGEEPGDDELPDDSDVITPTDTISPTDTVSRTTFVNCTGANPHPKGTKLAAEHGVDYEEIMDLFCNSHFGFGEIDHLYTLSDTTKGITTTQIYSWRIAGYGWGQIKKWVYTDTWSFNPNGTFSDTLLLPNLNPKKNGKCQDPKDIADAQALAAQYGGSSDTIQGWACDGFNMNEIQKAYGMIQGSGTPIEEILTLRASGLSWGEIKKLLKAAPTTSGQSNKPNNKPNKGNKGNIPWESNEPVKTPPGRTKPPKPGKP